jgi:hypothetical protein
MLLFCQILRILCAPLRAGARPVHLIRDIPATQQFGRFWSEADMM